MIQPPHHGVEPYPPDKKNAARPREEGGTQQKTQTNHNLLAGLDQWCEGQRYEAGRILLANEGDAIEAWINWIKWGNPELVDTVGADEWINIVQGKRPDAMYAAPISDIELSSARLSPDVVVENMLFADVGMLIAQGGMGKTTLLLHMLACIVLGRDVLGEKVKKPGHILYVTHEDSREILVARLREVMVSMDLSTAERRKVQDGIRILDKSGSSFRLTVIEADMVVVSPVVDDLVELAKKIGPVLVVFDPAVSFGVGESRINDAEQGLVNAGRKLRNELNCCVLYVHHTGKAPARDKIVDQYAGRGGSTFPDGSRMVLVLDSIDADGFKTETAEVLTTGENGLIMYRPKLSYCPKQSEVYIKRAGWGFDAHKALPAQSAEDAAKATEEQVYNFIKFEFGQGRKYSKDNMRSSGPDAMKLTRKQVMSAVSSLEVSRRIEYVGGQGKSGSHFAPTFAATDESLGGGEQ